MSESQRILEECDIDLIQQYHKEELDFQQ
jgi:major vault protein